MVQLLFINFSILIKMMHDLIILNSSYMLYKKCPWFYHITTFDKKKEVNFKKGKILFTISISLYLVNRYIVINIFPKKIFKHSWIECSMTRDVILNYLNYFKNIYLYSIHICRKIVNIHEILNYGTVKKNTLRFFVIH